MPISGDMLVDSGQHIVHMYIDFQPVGPESERLLWAQNGYFVTPYC